MELTASERMQLLQILPKEGDFATIRQVRKLRESLSFSDDDWKTFGLARVMDEQGNPTGAIRWNEKGLTTDIVLGEIATDLIVTTLRTLNDRKLLTEEHFSLYEKFIENAKE
jgi:hypothetical protein